VPVSQLFGGREDERPSVEATERILAAGEDIELFSTARAIARPDHVARGAKETLPRTF
jgi:hypothetical protein